MCFPGTAGARGAVGGSPLPAGSGSSLVSGRWICAEEPGEAALPPPQFASRCHRDGNGCDPGTQRRSTRKELSANTLHFPNPPAASVRRQSRGCRRSPKSGSREPPRSSSPDNRSDLRKLLLQSVQISRYNISWGHERSICWTSSCSVCRQYHNLQSLFRRLVAHPTNGNSGKCRNSAKTSVDDPGRRLPLRGRLEAVHE